MQFVSFISKTQLLLFPGRFTSIVRSLFGLNKVLSEQQESIEQQFRNGVGLLPAVREAQRSTIMLAERYNRFSRWLLGMDEIITGYNKIAEEISLALVNHVMNEQKEERFSGLAHLSQAQVLEKTPHQDLDIFLDRKQKFIESIPKQQLEKLSSLGSQKWKVRAWSSPLNQGIITYASLKQESIVCGERADRERNWNPVDRGGKATKSRVIDACSSNRFFVSKDIENISKNAIVVTINEFGNPEVTTSMGQK